MINFRKIIYYSTFLLFVLGAVNIAVTCEIPSSGLEGIKVSQTAAILNALFILYGAYFLYTNTETPKEKSKSKIILRPSINLDKIPYDDIEWIEEIKLRKKRGDKMAAYSSKGEAAARRKAKALGLEDCFVKFLSEEEVKKQRGWK